MSWNSDDLAAKAKVYLDRAFRAERASELFPFWCSMSLELYGRAVVANVSPALLADPNQGDSILYAFGLAPSGKSIQAKTVFERCRLIVEDFSKEDFDFAMFLMDRRNAEVHTGEAAFVGLPQSWVASFLRLIMKLLPRLELELAEIVPEGEITWLEQVSEAEDAAIAGSVKKKVNVCRQYFDLKPGEERVKLHEEAKRLVPLPPNRRVDCPACDGPAVQRGELKVTRDPVLRDETLYTEFVFLPTAVTCASCGLNLPSFSELVAAGLGGAFTVTAEDDPVEHFGNIYVDNMSEPDYGND
jgi:hypothetical protein